MSSAGKRLLFFCVLFLFLQGLMPLSAQTVVSKSADSTAQQSALPTITTRKFDDEAVQDLAKQRAFKYYEVEPVDNRSWWESLLKWLGNLIEQLFFDKSGQPNALGYLVKWLFVGGLAFAIIYVALKYLGLDLKLFSRSAKNTGIAYSEGVENIHQIDFEAELSHLVANKNYRLAVRMLYLRTLKRLSDRSMIVWHPEKTNRNYLAELTSHKQLFGKLTHTFDYVWYGDFPLDDVKYNHIFDDFTQFENHLK